MSLRIYHCYTSVSTFVIKDCQILNKIGVTIDFHFKVRKKWLLPKTLLKQFVHLLFNGWKIDVFVIQFSGYHSLLPCFYAKISGKKSIIIAGGTDCVSFPKIGYGNFNKAYLRKFTKWSFQLCSAVVPKHESLWYSTYSYDPREPNFQGIQAFIKSIKQKFKVINNGYDAEIWKVDPSIYRKPKHFITITGGFEYPFQTALKGIDLILEVAQFFPDCEFTIAGVPDWKKLDVRSDNINVLPPIPHHDLPKVFSSHAYYIQLSIAEGFPNALCEAMLCGCTPIVSGVFSMPEIAGENAYILEKRDVTLLRKLLERVLLEGPASPEKNHELIASRYPAERREKELLELIRSLGCL